MCLVILYAQLTYWRKDDQFILLAGPFLFYFGSFNYFALIVLALTLL